MKTLKETLKADGQTLKADNSRKKNKNRNMNLYERFERCMAQIVHNGVNMSAKGKFGNSFVIASLDELCRRTYLTDMPTLEQRKELEEFLDNLNSNSDKYAVVTTYPIGIEVEASMFSVMSSHKYGETGMVLYEMVINSTFFYYLDVFLYHRYDELEQDASKYAPTSKEDVDNFYEERTKYIAELQSSLFGPTCHV